MSIRLFEPLVEESRQHPNFRTIMRPGNGFALDVLSDWARGFEDRDGKFVEEFQTTFNSAFWELYLYAVFKKYGLAVDFSHARPDFCIPESGLVVEAAVASNAKDEEPEHARRGKEPPPDLNAFNFKSILRLSNSLTEKHKKYTQSYAQLDHVKEQSYVIAVTSFDRPFSFVACQRPIEAVLHGYYVDEERHIATNGREGRLEGEQLQRVFKDNGSPVELGLFRHPPTARSAPSYSAVARRLERFAHFRPIRIRTLHSLPFAIARRAFNLRSSGNPSIGIRKASWTDFASTTILSHRTRSIRRCFGIRACFSLIIRMMIGSTKLAKAS